MGRQSFVDKIISSGMDTVHRRGFATAGLREITKEAGVAQGSFTNHFSSKEAFGIAILDHYYGQLDAIMAATLADETLQPLPRLHAYFDFIIALFAKSDWRYGCLTGNMGLEATEHSEPIRLRLGEIFSEWTPHFAAVIRDGQKAGNFRTDVAPEDLGAAVLEAWQGAMLRMKIDRSPDPLERFKTITLKSLLGERKK